MTPCVLSRYPSTLVILHAVLQDIARLRAAHKVALPPRIRRHAQDLDAHTALHDKLECFAHGAQRLVLCVSFEDEQVVDEDVDHFPLHGGEQELEELTEVLEVALCCELHVANKGGVIAVVPPAGEVERVGIEDLADEAREHVGHPVVCVLLDVLRAEVRQYHRGVVLFGLLSERCRDEAAGRGFWSGSDDVDKQHVGSW